MKRWLISLDKRWTEVLRKIGVPFLRYSLAFLFIWFGLQKPFGLSAVQDLVARTVYWFDPSWFVPFLGWWEVAIGLCLLWKPLLRLGLALLSVQLVGTFLPFIVAPEMVFAEKLYLLTLEGQFIVKNLVIIGAAMVIGSQVRKK